MSWASKIATLFLSSQAATVDAWQERATSPGTGFASARSESQCVIERKSRVTVHEHWQVQHSVDDRRTLRPGGDGRPARGLPAGPHRDARAGRAHRLQRGAGRGRRGELGQAAQGPVLPRLLRHPRGRLRRRDARPSRSRRDARADPAPRRSRSSASATSATRSPATAGSPPAASASPRCSTPTRPGSARRSRADGAATSPSSHAVVAERGVTIGVHRDAGRARRRTVCDRLVARRGHQHPELRARPCCRCPADVDVRKVDLAVELQILSFHEARGAGRGRDGRRDRRSTRSTDRRWVAMSLLVVGSVAPHGAGVGAGAGRGVRPTTCRKVLDELLARRARRRGAAALDLQPGRGLRRRRDASTAASPRSPRCWPRQSGIARRRAGRPPLRALRRGRGRAPVLGGRRARLDGRRRVADPRPAARPRTRAAPRRAPSARVLHELAQQALRVGKRVHSRDRHRPRRRVRGRPVALRRRRAAVLGGLAGRRALVVGAGSMGALAAARRCAARRRRDRGRQPHLGAARHRLAELARRGAPPARRPSWRADEIAAADVRGHLAPAPTGLVVERRHGPAAARPPRPLVVLDLGAAARRRPGRRPRSPASPTSTSATLRADGALVSDAEVERRAPTHRRRRSCATTWPRSAARGRADRHRAARPGRQVIDAELLRLDGRLPGLDAAVRARGRPTRAPRVEKVLHAPTVRVQGARRDARRRPYAEALRELFDLDPRRRRGRSPRTAETAASAARRATSDPRPLRIGTRAQRRWRGTQTGTRRRRRWLARGRRSRSSPIVTEGDRSTRRARPDRRHRRVRLGAARRAARRRDRRRRPLVQGPADRAGAAASRWPRCRRARIRATRSSPATA